MRRQILFLVPLVTLAMVAGCDSNDGAESDKSSTSPVASPDGSDGTDSLESCLVGKWQPDLDLMVEEMGIPQDADFKMSGSFILEFKAGGDFAMNINLDVSGVGDGGEVFVGNIDNTANGTWTTSGDELAVTIADSQSTSRETVDGVEQPTDTSASDFSDWFGPDNPATVTCSATALVLDAGNDDVFPLQRQ